MFRTGLWVLNLPRNVTVCFAITSQVCYSLTRNVMADTGILPVIASVSQLPGMYHGTDFAICPPGRGTGYFVRLNVL